MPTKLSEALKERIREKKLSDVAKVADTTPAPTPDITTKEVEAKEKEWVPYGITSFAQLDATRAAREKAWEVIDLADDYQSLMWHILDDFSIDDKARALEILSSEFIVRLRQATAQKALEDAEPPVEAVETEPAAAPVETAQKTIAESTDPSGMFVYKDLATGRWRFNAIWSNNFEDRDDPPDIISKASHLDFIEMCHKGVVPYPEAWTWHIPAPYGQYDDLMWVEGENKSVGFTVGYGYFLEGFEEQAEAMSKMREIGVSHGMLVLERDPADPRVIKSHITYEISDLPAWAAANELTAFMVDESKTKELPMPLSDAQKVYLREKNFTEDRIKAMDQAIIEKEVIAQTVGMAHKSADVQPPAAAPAPAPAAAPAPAPAPAAAVEETDEVFTEAQTEVLTGLTKTIKSLFDDQAKAIETLAKSISMLAGVPDEDDEDEDDDDDDDEYARKAKKKLKSKPRAAGLVEVLNKALMDDDAKIDENHPLVKSGPKTSNDAPEVYGIPFLDNLIAGK